MRTQRSGLSILEIMVALTVLSLGVIPLFQLFSTTRGIVGQSRAALTLENLTLQAVAEVEALVALGHFDDLPPAQEEVLERSVGSVAIQMTVARQDAKRVFRVDVRATTQKQFFEVALFLVDPLASVHTWNISIEDEGDAHDS